MMVYAMIFRNFACDNNKILSQAIHLYEAVDHPEGILSPLSLGGVRGGENRIVTPQSPQGDVGR